MSESTPAWARRVLGHRFGREDLLEAALTHPSAKSRSQPSYERLEFLGDRVLGLVMAEHLYNDFEEPEGSMNRRLSALVDKQSCARVAEAIGVPAHVRLEASARQSGVHHSENLLGDVCEALIGALFLDSDYQTAARFILSAWKERLDAEAVPPLNPKNALQEWAQGRGLPIPEYHVVSREGPAHAPRFEIEVHVRGKEAAHGTGSSKQEAEKAAATAMLKREGRL